MYAPKSIKQSLAIDFFLFFALISQQSFFCINPNSARFVVIAPKKV